MKYVGHTLLAFTVTVAAFWVWLARKVQQRWEYA